MAELNLRNIRKTYPSSTQNPRLILDGITLTVHSGEIVVLLGPSGCGKTTLLKIIAGLVRPDAGDFALAVNERPITKPGPDRNIVFQDYTSYPWLTVRENVRFGLQFRDMTKAEQYRRADEYVKIVGLWDYKDEFPKVLSGGQQQRVAIARTLAGDPQVILMDEPFAALDAQTREAMQAELLQLQKKTNCTILFVTHDVAEAAFLGNRVLILSGIPARITDEVNTKTERDLIGERVGSLALRDDGSVSEEGFIRADDFRYSPRFLEIQRRLKDKLAKEAGANSRTFQDH